MRIIKVERYTMPRGKSIKKTKEELILEWSMDIFKASQKKDKYNQGVAFGMTLVLTQLRKNKII